MKQVKSLYLIDISSFIFRAFFAIRKLTTSQGLPVNAVYGVTNMLLQIIEKNKPSAIVCVFDTPKPSFRKEMYEEYKSNRGAPPDELIPQFDLIKESVQKMGIKCLSKEGFEADDIIASLSNQFEDCDVKVVTGDKDLMQLVNDRVQVVDTMKNITYGPKEVKEKLGVNPENVTDLLGLVGDSSDNIPGVDGIGMKGAIELINEFGSIDQIYKSIDSMKEGKKKESLLNGKKMAILSKKLATVHNEPIKEFKNITIDELIPPVTYSQEFIDFIAKMEFKSLLKKLTNDDVGIQEEKVSIDQNIKKINKLNEIESFLKKSKVFSIYTDEFDHNLILQNQTGVIQFEPSEQNVRYFVDTIDKLESIMIGYDLKKIYKKILFNLNLETKIQSDLFRLNQNHFDILIAHYLIDADEKHDLELINNQYASSSSNLKNNFIQIYENIKKELVEKNLDKIFKDIEMQVCLVLAIIECNGIQVDIQVLKKLSKEYDIEIKSLQTQIFKDSGEEFNINSPKQLSNILFEKLKLPVISKTKTGYSTDAEVLGKLAKLHSVPQKIIKFREYSKLKSTYIDSLPELVESDGRIHASFNQAVAATGRLSSSDPNLQNIPIKTEAGRKIRIAFVAPNDSYLIGADYSQIELRVIAHLSSDSKLIEAFNDGKDIHKTTAAEIFHININDVTEEQRSAAKAINFGLIYGKTAFGLSQELNISRSEAQNYIDAYFNKYKQVKDFLDNAIQFAKKHGFSQTMFGRKRIIKDISNKNMAVRNFAERMAMNTPVQGTAADIIKIAMVEVTKKLEKVNSKLLLQVHDELVIESKKEYLEESKKLLKSEMENAVQLKVPLIANVGFAQNWYDL